MVIQLPKRKDMRGAF